MRLSVYKRKNWWILCLWLIFLTGCNTARGAVRDLGETARNLSDVLHLGRDIERISK